MIDNLMLWNFPKRYAVESHFGADRFVLKTCQRTLVLSIHPPENKYCLIAPQADIDQITGEAAYEYLLEIICGLKSQLLGENEIVAQFRSAYQAYASQSHKNSEILRILEKLFKDAKEIRSKYLIGLGQKTYASLTRKHLMRTQAQKVLILGSGQLAEDMVNQLKKKTMIFLSARNELKVRNFEREHQIFPVNWESKKSWLNYSHIVNTIGFEGELLGDTFFQEWQQRHLRKCFIDLGSPSCITTKMKDSPEFIELSDIFKEGAIVEDQKEVKIANAKNFLKKLSKRRAELMRQKSFHWQANMAKRPTATLIH